MNNWLHQRIQSSPVVTLTLFFFIPVVILIGSHFFTPIISYAAPMTKKVVVVRYDPSSPQTGDPLSQDRSWNDASEITNHFVDKMKQVTNNQVMYQIVDTIRLDKFPLKLDGFRYDWDSYSHCRSDESTCHSPDEASYLDMMNETGLCSRIQSGDVDEIWLWGAGYFGFDEFAFKIPNDAVQYPTIPYEYWRYDGRKKDLPECGRPYFVMGWIPEVGLDNAMHSYGHRIESALTITAPGEGFWQRCSRNSEFTQFICTDHDGPGNAACGDVHTPPNAYYGYDYNNSTVVPSYCDEWFNYPTINTTVKKNTSNSAWTQSPSSAQEDYLTWWLSHIPSNWWPYIVELSEAPLPPASFIYPSPTPPSSPLPPTFTNLSASLSLGSAMFTFSYNRLSSGYAVDLSTQSDMSSDYYLSYVFGPSSPLIENNPTKWNAYSCGKTIYWRVRATAVLATQSPIQSATIACPTPTPLPVCSSADINKDGIVNDIDYTILITDFLSTTPSNPRSDINGDGVVDITDYSLYVTNIINAKPTGQCL